MSRVPAELWKNKGEYWPNDNGPDPRMSFTFTVFSRDAHQLDFNSMRIPNGEWSDSAKTLESAYKLYQKRIQRPETVECDLQMCIEFGGYLRKLEEPIVPQFSSSYIFIARWRKDGAFIESYHMNDIVFAEREPEQNIREPGLLSHWIEAAAKRQKKVE